MSAPLGRAVLPAPQAAGEGRAPTFAQKSSHGGRWAKISELLTFSEPLLSGPFGDSHFLLASFSLGLPPPAPAPAPATPGSSILLTTGKAERGWLETLHSGALEARLEARWSARRTRRMGGGDGAGATRALSWGVLPSSQDRTHDEDN